MIYPYLEQRFRFLIKSNEYFLKSAIDTTLGFIGQFTFRL
jgi:hypothetical protein